jgi:hypothetical protein
MTVTKCHVCHVEDELRNLTKLTDPEGVYAHKRCIEQHNKDVEKNLQHLQHTLAVSDAASSARDHDIDPSDSWAVEKFLRGQNPKVGKRFVAEVVAAAREQRDCDNMDALFDRIEENVAALPAEIGEDFISEATTDLADIISQQLADDDWRSDGAIETKAARYAALLLIKQVAWRKHQDKMREAARQFAEEENAF